MSTLDYLVTKMKRHVRASSADSPPTPPDIDVEEEVELRVSEDEGGGGGGGGLEEEEAARSAHLRPPSFNPEDYAQALAKYIRTPHVYLEINTKEKKGRGDRGRGGPGGMETRGEMSLRQFSSLPELLKRLREDLKMAYLSFVKELVREPHDGVSLLLDALKSVQLSQTDLTGRGTTHAQQMALRRALADEHEVLSCLRYCLRSPDAPVRVARYPPGLYTLAVATLSNLPRSRTIALELLTRACGAPGGRGRVMEALATLRLRFAEPVTCKFLVAMMLSHPHPSLQVWGLRLMNALVSSSESVREKVYLQEEITLAGLHPPSLRKVIERNGSEGGYKEAALKELVVWEANYVDVGSLHGEVDGLKRANSTLQDELAKLRQANMKLLEENVLLKTVGGEVEERCAALQRRLDQSGLPMPPSPNLSFTDSDLSSLATIRSRRPRQPSPARSCETETDSVIFRPSRGPHDDVSSDDTVIPSRPPSASSSSLLLPNASFLPPQISRNRHHSSPSSTLEFAHPTTSPVLIDPSPATHSEVKVVEVRESESRNSKTGETEAKFKEIVKIGAQEVEERGRDSRGIERTNNSRGIEKRGSENIESEIRVSETKVRRASGKDGKNSENKENEVQVDNRANESRSGNSSRENEIKIHEPKPRPEDRFNESRPSPLIDLTLRSEVKPQPSTQQTPQHPAKPYRGGSSRQRQQVSEQPPALSPRTLSSPVLSPTPPTPPSISPPALTPPPGETVRIVGEIPKGEKLSPTSVLQSQRSLHGQSPSPTSNAQSSSSASNKSKTHNPPPTTSPLSSSTSSLSSSSAPSSPEAGQRMDPEYMNVPRRTETRDEEPRKNRREKRGNSGTGSSGEMRNGCEDSEVDYERDVGVYEAVTVAGDRIFIQNTDTQGSGGSSSSQGSRNSRKTNKVNGNGVQDVKREKNGIQEHARKMEETKGSSENNAKNQESNSNKQESSAESSVMESVRHYENLVMMAEQTRVEPRVEGKAENRSESGNSRNGEIFCSEEGREKENESVRRYDDVTEGEVEAVMSGLENVLRSAESSLSLASQETVKEINDTRDQFEDRSSPGVVPGEELEIVPTRVPHPPARPHSHASPATTPRDPILFLEMESPAETSDTETLRNPRPGSPHTIETESTRSFGYIQPDVALRRNETMTERGGGGSGEKRRQQLRRCESFQAAGSECEYEYDSHRSYSPRHRTTAEQHVPMRETPVHISGRVFTRYTPQEVERRNRVNNLITAELAKRKNRSVEDRLDQWHGAEEDWTLRWRYPDVHPDPQSRPGRTRSRTRSPSRRDPPRRSRSSTRHSTQPVPPQVPHKPSRGSKFSNSELIAFTGFRNPNGGGFRESDYGPNFMLNTPSPRLPDFTDYGGRDFPPQMGPLPPHRSSRERGGGGGRRKADFDPDIPTPDYTATPAGTLTAPAAGSPSKHILDMPSGLY